MSIQGYTNLQRVFYVKGVRIAIGHSVSCRKIKISSQINLKPDYFTIPYLLKKTGTLNLKV